MVAWQLQSSSFCYCLTAFHIGRNNWRRTAFCLLHIREKIWQICFVIQTNFMYTSARLPLFISKIQRMTIWWRDEQMHTKCHVCGYRNCNSTLKLRAQFLQHLQIFSSVLIVISCNVWNFWGLKLLWILFLSQLTPQLQILSSITNRNGLIGFRRQTESMFTLGSIWSI
jgi:hypothetical protein